MIFFEFNGIENHLPLNSLLNFLRYLEFYFQVGKIPDHFPAQLIDSGSISLLQLSKNLSVYDHDQGNLRKNFHQDSQYNKPM